MGLRPLTQFASALWSCSWTGFHWAMIHPITWRRSVPRSQALATWSKGWWRSRFLIAARSARLSATPVRKSAFALAGQWTEKILCPRFRCPHQLLPLTECSSKNLLLHRLFKAICERMKLAVTEPHPWKSALRSRAGSQVNPFSAHHSPTSFPNLAVSRAAGTKANSSAPYRLPPPAFLFL